MVNFILIYPFITLVAFCNFFCSNQLKLVDLNSSPGTKSEVNNNLMVFTAVLFSFGCRFVSTVLQLASWPVLFLTELLKCMNLLCYSWLYVRKFVSIIKEVKYQHPIASNYMKGKGKQGCALA